MELSELLKKYALIQHSYQTGTLSTTIIPIFETVQALISTGDVFQTLKLHYVDGMTVEEIAEKLSVEPRTVYRRQKNELAELESIVNGNWIRIIPPPMMM